MYMHKDGVKYYVDILKQVVDLLKEQKNDEKSLYGAIAHMKITLGYDLADVNIDLNKHLKNILDHIKSTENKVNAFFQRLGDSLPKDFRSDEHMIFIDIVNKLNDLEKTFENAKKDSDDIANALKLIRMSHSALDISRFAEAVEILNAELYSIHNFSMLLAAAVKNIVVSIKKEEEFIKKKDIFMVDFEKNIQSWFSEF